MERRLLVFSTISILLLSMLASCLIATVAAEKTTVPYQYTLKVSEIPGTVSEKWSQDGHVDIRTGNQRVGTYNGPLGVGTWYSENVLSISYLDIPPSTPFVFAGSVGHGFGIYKATLVINNGPYGSGTLEGVSRFSWDYDLRAGVSTRHYDINGITNLQGGTDDLKGIKLDATTYQNGLNTVGMIQIGEITLP